VPRRREANNRKFGEELRRLRQSRYVTITELAKKVGVSKSYISSVERGIFQPPTVELMETISIGLHLSDSERIKLFVLARKIPEDISITVINIIGTEVGLLYLLEFMDKKQLELLLEYARSLLDDKS
jgi:transcriptional regulator with XRE-family HTH domain